MVFFTAYNKYGLVIKTTHIFSDLQLSIHPVTANNKVILPSTVNSFTGIGDTDRRADSQADRHTIEQTCTRVHNDNAQNSNVSVCLVDY